MKQSFNYRKIAGRHIRIFLRLFLYLFFCIIMVKISIAFTGVNINNEANRQNTEIEKKTVAKESSNTKEHTGQITGFVYVTKGSGESNILRGQQMFLIRADSLFEEDRILIKHMLDEFSAAFQKGLRLIDEDDTPDEQLIQYGLIGVRLSTFDVLDSLLYNYYSQSSFVSTYTDVDGKYKFSGLPSGTYAIYSRFHTHFDVVYWLVDVKISQNKITKLDLSNYNLTFLKEMFSIDSFEDLKERLERKLILHFERENIHRILQNGKNVGVENFPLRDFFSNLKKDK